MFRWIALLGVAGLSTSASACPLCNTETGAQVRALVFGADFLAYLAATIAPMPILIAFVAGTGLLDRFTATPGRPPGA